MKTRASQVAIACICLLAVGASGCTLSLLQLPTLPASSTSRPATILPTEAALPKAQTTFMARLAEPMSAADSLALALLDEVTGLALNPELYPMESADGLTYKATLALPYRAVVKYRYVRLGASQVPEQTASGADIRYRLYFASGPAEVTDLIARWSDTSYSGQTGNIQGLATDAKTGAPLPSLLVTAGGYRAFSDSAGRFELPGLPLGTHNLVAYSIDGTYETFQQGATVASGLNTVVAIRAQPAALVRVTFSVTAPSEVQGAPLRIAGNLLELGNTFADLQGGMSTIADRMPVMALQTDGTYSASISLPVGAYVQYKYTLGDGFWNAEHSADGRFRLRELIVPAQDSVIHDQVVTWKSGASAPILFEVTVSRDTPTEDLIYVQLNPFTWTEPLPMWPLGNNRWAYKLYGPVNTLGNLHYRYCRDGQCGSADDLSTAGTAAQGRTVETSLTEQDLKDTVSDWAWLQNMEPTTLVGTDIGPRSDGFVAGVELQTSYRPNWSYYNPQTVQSVQALGANWLIFTPSWTFGSAAPLEFGISPEQDPFRLDSAIMVSQARAANLNVGLFPVPHFATSASDFWASGTRDGDWWQAWFDHYRAFAVNFADLAAQSGSQALVLGGDWLDPALPGGTLADGSPSDVPADSEVRWQAILNEVRQHFTGKLWWAMPYTPGRLQSSLSFLSSTDGIYLLWSAPLAADASASTSDMLNQAGQLLDNEVGPLASFLGKPIILGAAYPSAAGVQSGCLTDGQAGCLDWTALNQPNNPPSVNLDLQAQADVYDALLNAVNSRAYIAGIVSRGYYPPAVLQDKSASVRGKPAADLLWYWFPRLLGVVH